MPLSPPKPLDPNVSISRLNAGQRQGSPKKHDPFLTSIIHQIGSPDPNMALQGLQQMIEFLQSTKSGAMVNYENEFFRSMVTQLKHLRGQDAVSDHQVAKIYRSLLTAIDAVSCLFRVTKIPKCAFQFYHNKNFGQHGFVENLKDIVDQLIHVLVDAKLENCTNGDAYVRVINLHCVKIIEKSDHTKIIWLVWVMF